MRSEWRTRYSVSLRAGRFGVRSPLGARHYAPVHRCPEAHPAFLTILFPGNKAAGEVTLTTNGEVQERAKLQLYPFPSTYLPSWHVIG